MRKYLFVLITFLLSISLSYGQEKLITGKVLSSSDNTPLPGVSIIVKNTSIGGVTDINGQYKVSVPADAEVLVFNFVGYEKKELPINNQSVIDVMLDEEVDLLSEVVVTAIGLKKDKASLGYAVQEVNSDEIMGAGEQNFVNALNGRVAGVQVNSSGGAPGAGTFITIRGVSSLTGNNQPLFVIDGIPIDNNTTTTENPTGNATDLNQNSSTASNRAVDINPNEIASISVLKGPAATILYGIRAANGAVIITTKDGSGGASNKLNINYSGSYSVDEINKIPEFTDKYGRGRNGAYSNVTHWSWGAPYGSGRDVFPTNTTPKTQIYVEGKGLTDVSGQKIPFFADNYKRFWDIGNTMSHNISFSKSMEKVSFYTSLGRQDQTGIVPNTNFRRTTVALRGKANLSKNFVVSTSINFINSGGKKALRGEAGIGAGLVYFHNMWDIRGQYKDENNNKTWFSNGVVHPMWAAQETALEDNVNRIIGNLNFSYTLFEGINLNWKVGIDNYSDDRRQIMPIGSVGGYVGNREGQLRFHKINNTDINSDLILTIDKSIGEDFGIKALVGHNYYQSNYDAQYILGDKIEIKGFHDITGANKVRSFNSTDGKILTGVYADITLDYKDILYLGLSARNDWSSTLPEKNNSFFYPAVNLGFVFTELMPRNEILSLGKFRASWAQVGKDAPSQSLKDNYTVTSPGGSAGGGSTYSSFGGRKAFGVSNTKKNPDLKPETTTSYEFGLDLRFWQNKVGLDITYFNQSSTDQIVSKRIAASTGFTSSVVNVGEITNNGIELLVSLNTPVTFSPDFQWTTSFSFTKINNKVVSIEPGIDQIILGYDGWTAGGISTAQVGHPYGAFKGSRYQRNSAGKLVVGADGYPVKNTTDGIIGNYQPDWMLGISNGVNYKGIFLNLSWDFRFGNELFNSSAAAWDYAGLSKLSEQRNEMVVFDGVLADGTVNTQEVALTNNFFHEYRRVSENYVQDGSWIRLQNLTLGYELPRKLLEKTPFTKISIAFTARNLFLITNYSGVDPMAVNGSGHTNFQGLDYYNFPNTKSYGVNLNISL